MAEVVLSPLTGTHLKGGDTKSFSVPWGQLSCGDGNLSPGGMKTWEAEAGDGIRGAPLGTSGLGTGFPPSLPYDLPLLPENCWSRLQLPKCRCYSEISHSSTGLLDEK